MVLAGATVAIAWVLLALWVLWSSSTGVMKWVPQPLRDALELLCILAAAVSMWRT